MFKVLHVDGANITTDKGTVSLTRVQYADSGKRKEMSVADWRMLRDAVVQLPRLLEIARLICENAGHAENDEHFGDLISAEALPLAREVMAVLRPAE